MWWRLHCQHYDQLILFMVAISCFLVHFKVKAPNRLDVLRTVVPWLRRQYQPEAVSSHKSKQNKEIKQSKKRKRALRQEEIKTRSGVS